MNDLSTPFGGDYDKLQLTLHSLVKLADYTHHNYGLISQTELGRVALDLRQDYEMDNILFAEAVHNHGWVLHEHLGTGIVKISGPGFVYVVKEPKDMVESLIEWQLGMQQYRREHPWLYYPRRWAFIMALTYQTLRVRWARYLTR